MPTFDLVPRFIGTSVWTRADRKSHEALTDRLRELLVAGSVWICWPSRVELLIGVKTPERWATIKEQMATLKQAKILDQTWELASPLGPSACQNRLKRSAARPLDRRHYAPA